MASARDRSPEDLIRDGREHYASKRYKPALETFTRAMKRCPCTRQMKRERCTCKDYEKAAAESRSLFNEAMYNCKCEVGRTFNKCDSRLHIQALDYRAATFEAMGELDRAKRDAEWMLELAPRLPDGYLRFGKALRLQKKNEFAWRVYSAGIEATAAQDNAINDPKVKQLYIARQPLHTRYFRHDPMQLPMEIVQMIFTQLDLKTLVRCTCVSHTWRNGLTSAWNAVSWRNLSFPSMRGNVRPPTAAALIALMSYSGNRVRHISIPDANKFRLSQKKFQAILGAAKKLEHLEIHEPFEQLSAASASLPSLKRLILGNRGLPRGLLTHVADTLESLHIKMLENWDVTALKSGPPLLKLKYLRLESPRPGRFYCAGLMHHMPNLQQLCLVRCVPSALMLETDPAVEPVNPWVTLKALVVLGLEFRDWDYVRPLAMVVNHHFGNSFRHLEVTGSHMFADREGRTWLDPDHEPPLENDHGMWELGHVNRPNTFRNMECFRTRNIVVDPGRCQEMMRQTFEAEKLHSIDIVFNQPPLNEAPEGSTCTLRLERFGWLRGSTAIRSLGLFNFRFKRYPRNEDDLPLLGFVGSLPSLEILEINSEQYDDAELASVITDIIKNTESLKKIYQATVKGTNLDRLKSVAKRANIELIWGERPVVWPVPILNPEPPI